MITPQTAGVLRKHFAGIYCVSASIFGVRVDINAEVTDDSGWRDLVSANSKRYLRQIMRISDLAVFN